MDYISVDELKGKLNGRFDVRQIMAIKRIIDECQTVSFDTHKVNAGKDLIKEVDTSGDV